MAEVCKVCGPQELRAQSGMICWRCGFRLAGLRVVRDADGVASVEQVELPVAQDFIARAGEVNRTPSSAPPRRSARFSSDFSKARRAA